MIKKGGGVVKMFKIENTSNMKQKKFFVYIFKRYKIQPTLFGSQFRGEWDNNLHLVSKNFVYNCRRENVLFL